MTTSARLAWVLPLLVVLTVAGCSSSGAASPAASLPVRPSQSLDLPPTAPPSGAPSTGEVPEAVLQAIQQQLAIDVPGVDLSASTTVTSEAVEWPDGSLGCPEPGMFYTQVITPGYHVVISVDGVEYDYRATDAGQVRLCQAPGPLGT
jgi:hypothetical protein